MNETLIFRCLKESEVQVWSEFCAQCFSYKPNPPPSSYFKRHFDNDPRRDASLIFVAIDSTSTSMKIVSSVRIFRRTISVINNDDIAQEIEVGGVGEVCTDSSYRKKGLANQLLQMALHKMRGLDIQMSMLHANVNLQHGVYEKIGYRSVTTFWNVIDFTANENSSIKNKYKSSSNSSSSSLPHFVVQKLKNDSDITSSVAHVLYRLYKEYHSSKKSKYYLVRSRKYWEMYMMKEFEAQNTPLYTIQMDGKIVSWMSIGYRNGLLEVREFGLDPTYNSCVATFVSRFINFSLLNSSSSSQLGDILLDNNETNNKTTIKVKLPRVMLDEIQRSCDCVQPLNGNDLGFNLVDGKIQSKVDDDRGWCYQNLGCNNDLFDCIQDNTSHLIWPIDSF